MGDPQAATGPSEAGPVPGDGSANPFPLENGVPDYYFDSYSHYGIHEEMLKDRVRTNSYRNAIYSNKHLFKGKVVLDVGCGTGILCMFAAAAGARKVIGVDCSSIIEQAQQIVKDNGFEDTIVLMRGKMEELTLPEGIEKVDIIVSEWMGYFLLYESMLNTVLWARDRFLQPDGILLPSHSSMYICGIEDRAYRQEKIDFWDNVYGFSFNSVKQTALLEPLVDVVEPKQVVTTHDRILDLDLKTTKVEDLSFNSTFSIQLVKREKIHALVVYFDVLFDGHNPIVMTTSPEQKTTHWKQTVLYLKDPFTCAKGDRISGSIRAAPNAGNHRDLDIFLKATHVGKKATTTIQQDYRLR
eukprot:TRINITY_DN26073_c1_g2_i3.p1 TRINITY_DN26073_c1_g2~~TRINITY_DN26073_c1_g2_i3.p1  ORF type:complete len:383 (+),score=157.85 TRINITY_DN26073_c1_g2_i3:85-1149(+)